MDWTLMPSDDIIQKTADALSANGFGVYVASSGEDAKKRALELIPKGAEVMQMSSVTLDAIGLNKVIAESGNYEPVKKKLKTMDRETQRQDMKKLGCAPAWAIGSIHAITQDGHLLWASQSGSQMPAYVYGAGKVIWIAGCQKIVRNTHEGMDRIYEHCLPLETERARRVYGEDSAVNNLLIMNAQLKYPGRCVVILVKEKLGF